MSNEFDNITLCGTQIELSEDKSDPDIYRARFLISGFGVNKNNVQIDREHIEEWLSTLVDKPVVGKVSISSNGVADFESHNLRIVTKKKGNKTYKEAEFDTTPFGHFVAASIETAEDGKEYIYADAVLYKRYKNAIGVLERRIDNKETISTSWEIAVEQNTPKVVNGKIIKLIQKGRFLAHCFLGANVEPAFDESGLLAVAATEEQELDVALSQDCLDNLDVSSDIQNSTEKEENTMEVKEQIVVESAEQVDETVNTEASNSVEETNDNVNAEVQVEEAAEGETSQSEQNESVQAEESLDENAEVSALTVRDLRLRLEEAFRCNDKYGWIFMLFPVDNVAWFEECDRKSETEFVEVKYTVENDKVTITERNPVSLTVSPREINQVVAQKDNAIIEMSAQIKTLNETVDTLKPYKTKVEEIEKAEREAQFENDKKELSEYALSSGYISQEELETSEEIKGYIEKLDKTSIKSLISDRIVSAALAAKNTQEVETSASNTDANTNIQINLNIEEANEKKADVDAFAIIKRYLGK